MYKTFVYDRFIWSEIYEKASFDQCIDCTMFLTVQW